MTDIKAIRPLAEDGDSVLLRRADYEALVQEAEDAARSARPRRASRPARTSTCRSSSPGA